MIFEQQIHQQQCINSLLTCLKKFDLNSTIKSKEISEYLNVAPPSNYTKRFPILPISRLDVIMETGTGKTFTYLQLIHEIAGNLNKKKFIIILPRTAIKLGTVQNIKLTSNYFHQKYNEYLNVVVYPEEGIDKVQTRYIRGTGIDVLVTTNAAFNSQSNVINQTVEYSYMEPTVWASIAKMSPIVIIDEPHLLKGNHTRKGVAKLNNSTIIRFGATYPVEGPEVLSNVAYALDSISAFNKFLVKRVAVTTIIDENSRRQRLIHSIVPGKSFRVDHNVGAIVRSSTIRLGEDLGAKLNQNRLAGVTALRINKSNVRLSNGESWYRSIFNYELKDSEMESLIRIAIQKHFDREEKLFKIGVKALALFFIPAISDYRGSNPRIKLLFERIYAQVRKSVLRRKLDGGYREYLKRDYNSKRELQVHQGYFSGDKGTKEKKEAKGVDLILNDKEKLLSFSTSLRFVFSVWALQEGWDNPNIFTLCKLRSTGNEISRRQQIGRGLRLAVNRYGQRLSMDIMGGDEERFFDVNTLNVVVSGHEKDFISQIQSEIKAASFSFVGEVISLEELVGVGLEDTEAALVWIILTQHGVITDEGAIVQPIAPWMKDNRALFAQIASDRFDKLVGILESSGTKPVVSTDETNKRVGVRVSRWRDFRPLWTSINRTVSMSIGKLSYERVAAEVKSLYELRVFGSGESVIETSHYDTLRDLIVRESEQRTEKIEETTSIDLISVLVQNLSEELNLPVPFIAGLINLLDTSRMATNIRRVFEVLSQDILCAIYTLAIESVKYSFDNKPRLPNEMQDRNGKLIASMPFTKLGRFVGDKSPPDHYLFDHAVYDSSIELEAILTDPCAVDKNSVRAFGKLPRLRIPTPKGNYSPDFAYFIERDRLKPLVLVVETKGYDNMGSISTMEYLKIRYAERFFASLQLALPTFEVMFKTRLNNQSLRQLIIGAE